MNRTNGNGNKNLPYSRYKNSKLADQKKTRVWPGKLNVFKINSQLSTPESSSF